MIVCYKSLALKYEFNEIIQINPVLITYTFSQQIGEEFRYFLVYDIRLRDFHRVDHSVKFSILIESRFLWERERLSRSALSATRLLKFNYTRRSIWSDRILVARSLHSIFLCRLIIVKFIFVWSLIARCNRVSTATFLLIYPSTARRGFVLSFSRARRRIYS